MVKFLFDYADTYGSVIPLIAIIALFRKVPKETFILFWYFIFSILLFGYSNYLADRSIPSVFLYHIFSVAELAFLLPYFVIVTNSNGLKKISYWVFGAFIVVSIINILLLESLNSLNSNTLAIEFLVLIVYCFIYYLRLSQSEKIIDFLKEPVFWIVTGFFVYFSLDIIVFALYKYAVNYNRRLLFDFWDFQEIMYVVKNSIIAYGILCFRKARK